MSERILDCRGLACPQPVINTKNCIEENVTNLTVLVDNAAAKENVLKFLSRNNYNAEAKKENGDFIIKASRQEAACEIMDDTKFIQKKTIVLIGAEYLGKGDDELGRKLMVNFINTLKEMHDELFCIVFVNGGVKLAVQGSQIIETLRYFEQEKIKILLCGTCLNHFNLLEKKEAGETTNMLDIVSAMQLADKVINIT